VEADVGNGPEQLPDPSWWHALGTGIVSAVAGAAAALRVGQRKGKRDLAASLDDIERLTEESHALTRETFRTSLLDALREEREATFELVRSEGKENRKVIYALGESIGRRLESIDKDVTRLVERSATGADR
jgi:hypothetical protein